MPNISLPNAEAPQVPEGHPYVLGEGWSTDLLVDWLVEIAARSPEPDTANLRVCAKRLAALYYGDDRPRRGSAIYCQRCLCELPNHSTSCAEATRLAAENTRLVNMLSTLRDHAFIADEELLQGTVEQIDSLLVELRSAAPRVGGEGVGKTMSDDLVVTTGLIDCGADELWDESGDLTYEKAREISRAVLDVVFAKINREASAPNTPTAAMIERAARVLVDEGDFTVATWDGLNDKARAEFSRIARVALTAALGHPR